MNKAIRDYLDYEVSSDGIVYSLATGKPVKVSLSNGYEIVWLRNSLGGKSLAVHRIVAQAYLLRHRGKEVNHKDLNKRNNNVDNLEWCTHQQNITHAVMNGAYAGRITSYSQRSGKKLKTPLCYITL